MVRILGRTASWEGSGAAQPWRGFFFWLRRGLSSTGASLALFFFSLERTPSTKPRIFFHLKLEQKLFANLAGDPVKWWYGPKSYGSEFYTVLQRSACYIAPFRWATIYTIQTGQEILAQAATWVNNATQTRYYITRKTSIQRPGARE